MEQSDGPTYRIPKTIGLGETIPGALHSGETDRPKFSFIFSNVLKDQPVSNLELPGGDPG